MARPLSPTTKFILSLPSDLPVAEVVAKAEAAGLPTSKGNVYQVRRSHAKAHTKDSKVTKSVKASKKAKTPKKGTKAALKTETPVPSAANAAPAAPKKRGPGRPRKAAAAPKAAPKAASGGHSSEAAFRAAVSAYAVEYGLIAARAVLEDVGERIKAAGAG